MTWSWQGNRPMTLFGLAVLAALAVYFAFMAVNGLWLGHSTGTARVVEKRDLPGGQTYYTRIVNERPVVLWTDTPEAYLLRLDLAGEEVACVVAPSTFKAVRPGSEVRVVYQRRRLTGSIAVLDVRAEGEEGR
jgi:hypothetical protein